jgi:hypothetical protein
MKRIIITLAALAITALTHAQTYVKVETARFNKEGDITSKTIKYKPGNITIGDHFINIEGQPSLTIVTKGKTEAEDELYTSQTYVCIAEAKNGALKALKVVLFYTPKKQLCDLIVKNGHSNVDYCFTEK